MHLSAKLFAGVAVLAVSTLAPQAQSQTPPQTNGIASPIEKVSPTGAVTIPQAEIPSVGT